MIDWEKMPSQFVRFMVQCLTNREYSFDGNKLTPIKLVSFLSLWITNLLLTAQQKCHFSCVVAVYAEQRALHLMYKMNGKNCKFVAIFVAGSICVWTFKRLWIMWSGMRAHRFGLDVCQKCAQFKSDATYSFSNVRIMIFVFFFLV